MGKFTESYGKIFAKHVLSQLAPADSLDLNKDHKVTSVDMLVGLIDASTHEDLIERVMQPIKITTKGGHMDFAYAGDTITYTYPRKNPVTNKKNKRILTVSWAIYNLGSYEIPGRIFFTSRAHWMAPGDTFQLKADAITDWEL